MPLLQPSLQKMKIIAQPEISAMEWLWNIFDSDAETNAQTIIMYFASSLIQVHTFLVLSFIWLD